MQKRKRNIDPRSDLMLIYEDGMDYYPKHGIMSEETQSLLKSISGCIGTGSFYVFFLPTERCYSEVPVEKKLSVLCRIMSDTNLDFDQIVYLHIKTLVNIRRFDHACELRTAIMNLSGYLGVAREYLDICEHPLITENTSRMRGEAFRGINESNEYFPEWANDLNGLLVGQTCY